jgi:hypothetical protein
MDVSMRNWPGKVFGTVDGLLLSSPGAGSIESRATRRLNATFCPGNLTSAPMSAAAGEEFPRLNMRKVSCGTHFEGSYCLLVQLTTIILFLYCCFCILMRRDISRLLPLLGARSQWEHYYQSASGCPAN